MRSTKSHTKKRRSHHKVKGVQVSTCAKCGAAHMRHTVCENCGTYKGRQYIDVLAKLNKKERKHKEEELSRQEAENPQGLDAKKLSNK